MSLEWKEQRGRFDEILRMKAHEGHLSYSIEVRTWDSVKRASNYNPTLRIYFHPVAGRVRPAFKIHEETSRFVRILKRKAKAFTIEMLRDFQLQTLSEDADAGDLASRDLLNMLRETPKSVLDLNDKLIVTQPISE